MREILKFFKVILYNYYGEELQSYCYRLTSVSSILTTCFNEFVSGNEITPKHVSQGIVVISLL